MVKIGYNLGHSHLPKQTQEILRQKEKSAQLLEEEKKKIVQSLKMKIIEFLESKKDAVSKNDIAQVIAPNKLMEISAAIRELVRIEK